MLARWLICLLVGAMSFAAVPAPVAVAAPTVVAAVGEFYENPDFGVKFRPPKDWTAMPQQSDEQWQVTKYLSDKPYFWTDKNGGWTIEFKPELTLVAFVTEVTRKRAEVERKKEDGKDTITILLRNPYKDYLDYLKRTYNNGGWYVAEEKDIELEGVPVHVYDIKVEKLAYGGPKRIITWVYKQEDVDFALQFEVLEDSYPKLKQALDGVHRSFRLIPRTGGGLPGVETGGRLVNEDTSKLTPKQREDRRRGQERTAQEKALKTITEGWSTFKTKRFLVLHHTDEKYARRVAAQAEAIFAWCETTFPYVGPEEYVRSPVLRICKDSDEYNAFWTGGAWFSFGEKAPEIIAYNDLAGFQTGWAVERVNSELLRYWLHERDRELAAAMPRWLTEGLAETIGNARSDKTSGKLEFRVDDWSRDDVRELVRSGRAVRPRELVRMGQENFMGGNFESWFDSARQSSCFVFFLTAGPGAKDPKTKEVLPLYIRNLKQVVNDLRAADALAETAPKVKAETEEEEEAMFKAASEMWRKREQELLDQTFERTFRSWSDKQWDTFEQAYFKTVGGK
jgi:hypothetical protein